MEAENVNVGAENYSKERQQALRTGIQLVVIDLVWFPFSPWDTLAPVPF